MTFISIEEKPSHPKYLSYLWADYVELVCLFSVDGETSVQDIVDRLLNRERDLQEADAEELEDTRKSEMDVDGARESGNELPSLQSDKWESDVRDWFRVLELRSSLYGPDYPFQTSPTELRLKPGATAKTQPYLYLLFCSSLNFMDKKSSGSFSSSFELFCLSAFASCVPSDAHVRFFGMNGVNEDVDFGKHTTLWEKLNRLAALLSERLSDRISVDHYPNRGDEGLDILAVTQSYDDLPSKLIAFGQCTCEKEWKKKQHECKYDTWASKIPMLNGNSNVLMIPYCFRGADGQWFKPADIQQSYLLDRYRLLRTAQQRGVDIMSLPSASHFADLLLYKESIF